MAADGTTSVCGATGGMGVLWVALGLCSLSAATLLGAGGGDAHHDGAGGTGRAAAAALAAAPALAVLQLGDPRVQAPLVRNVRIEANEYWKQNRS